MTKIEFERRARQENILLEMGINRDDAETLRRCSRVLTAWGELECGDGNDYATWSVERDETTGKPHLVTYPHTGKSYRHQIPDRERGALRRISAICKAAGLHFYHQTDPRGAALHVSREPLTDQTYNRGHRDLLMKTRFAITLTPAE